MFLSDDIYQDRWQSLCKALNKEEADELLVNRYNFATIVSGRRVETWTPPFISEAEYLDWLLDFAIHQNVRLDGRQGAAGGYVGEEAMRWHVVLPPMAVGGPVFCLRRHRFDRISLSDFCLAPGDLRLLQRAMGEAGLIVVAGPTGSGKTTFLSAVLQAFCREQRVLVLETVAELTMRSDLWLHLVTRGRDIQGEGGFSLSRLLVESLRLRPERIVIGEIRGEEGQFLGQAMASGHGGVLCSLHAEDISSAERRLRQLCGSQWDDVASYPRTTVVMCGQGTPGVREISTTRPRASSRKS